MTTEDRSQITPGPRLARILADYLEALESGTAQDPEAWLARYPEFATELREFIAGHGRLREVVEQAAAGLALQTGEAPTLLGPAGDAGGDSSHRVRYFGDYELLEEIARGGMGVVYRARQTNLNRIVALKMILAGQLADESDVKRFYAEAEAAARLDHPGIVPIFEIGQHEGQHYFSMGYVAGESLARKSSEGPLPARLAATLARDVADAVQYAHDQGIVHRDLKPANVLVDSAGQPRVTDFGLAKQLSADSGLTGTGQVLGTPSFMPPEQAAGKIDQVGPRSDVYALGAILYCLLTGRPPFQAASPIDTLRQVLEQEPAPIRQLNFAVPRDLETIALKCLEKEPSRRYGSASEVSAELDRFLRGEPIVARPSTTWERTWKWARRNPALARSLAAVVLLAIALVVGSAVAAFRLAAAARTSRSLYLTSQSELLREEDPGLALVLALEAAELHPGPAANNAVLAVMDSNRELRTLAGHEGPVTGMAWSADGRRIVTTSDDKTARLWDGGTGASIATLAHDALVLAARFTPDGRRLVTLSTNHKYEYTQLDDYRTRMGEATIRVWDAEKGQLERSWKPSQPPRGAAFWEPNPRSALDISPDGSRAVVTFGGFPDRPPSIWNLADGKLLAELIGHAAPVHSVAFSPDGRQVVTASADQTARIWDAATGREEFGLKGHASNVWFATFNPAGTRVLTLADGNRTTYLATQTSVSVSTESNADTEERAAGRLWDAATGREVAALTWPKSSQGFDQNGFAGVARFSRDGTRIVTAGHGSNWGGEDPYHAAVWDAESGAFITSLRAKGRSVEPPLDAALSLDGTIAAAAFDDKQVHLWEARTGKQLLTLKGHHAAVRNVEFAPDGERLISTSDDGTAQIWDTRLIDADDRRRGIWPNVQMLVFNPTCGRVAAVKMTGRFEMAILDATTREEYARTEVDGFRGLDRPLFSTDGKLLLLHSRYQPFALHDAQSGVRLRELGGPAGYVGAAISPDGRFVAITSDDAAVLWETASGLELVRLTSTTEHTIANVMFSPDGGTLLTTNSGPGRSTGTSVPACLWDVPSGRKRAELKRQSPYFTAANCSHASFSPDGRRVATAVGNSAQIWDTASGRELVVLGPHEKQIYLALFAPDGRSVLTTGADGRAVLRNAASGREIWRLKGVENEDINHGEFTPDGRFLLTASHERRPSGSSFLNGAARLWDAATGAEICTFFRHESNLDSVTLSPDGRTAIVSYFGPADGSPCVTRTWPVDFLSLARARRPRDLTPQERARFELP